MPTNDTETVKFKCDSAASDHYVRPKDAHCLTNITEIPSRPIILPDRSTISATHQGQLPLHPSITTHGRTAKILPLLKSSSLISIGKLCNDNCDVTFNKQSMFVNKNDNTIMVGKRNFSDDLWDTQLPVHKMALHADNYIPPSDYSTLYHKSVTPSIITDSIPIKKQKRVNLLLEPFGDMHSLIEHNACDQAIKEATHQDYTNCSVYPSTPPQESLSVIIQKKQPQMDLAKYLHAACFSPVRSTFIKAIENNHFHSWPGLTPALIKKHLPDSIATASGHLTQENQHLQSTTKPSRTYANKIDELKRKLEQLQSSKVVTNSLNTTLLNDITHDNFPPSPTPNRKTNDVIYSVIDDNNLRSYMDLTGRFPQKSSRGNQYIMVGYHMDANSILAHPLKNRKAQTITTAWMELHDMYEKAGVAPNICIMDNEQSKELQTALSNAEVNFQLVPPHNHRTNFAERAIQTWKHHFKAGLASVDPNFPLSEWDRLIDQCNITLNLLRSSRSNPKLSAWAYLFGNFDFNTTPLAPPGTRIVAHIKANNRGSWELNGEKGWYVGRAKDHYRCVECYFPSTRSTRPCDTVTFFPTTIPFPQVGLTDHLRQAANDIVTILTQPPSTTVPSLASGDPTRNALIELATQLQRIEPIPAT